MVKHVGGNDTNCSSSAWNGPKRLGKKNGATKNRDHLDHSIVEIDQNTQKRHGDPTRLAVTQTPVKDHQATVVWKTHEK